MLNVIGGGHLGGLLEFVRVLPEIFEPVCTSQRSPRAWSNLSVSLTYSSVAFISGHVVGEQNSVIDPYY